MLYGKGRIWQIATSVSTFSLVCDNYRLNVYIMKNTSAITL